MCYTLSADKILLNYFAETKETSISVDRLNQISVIVMKACEDGILTHIDRDTVRIAVDTLSDVLSFDEGVISIKKEDNLYLQNMNAVNRNIPAYVRSTMQTKLRELHCK